MASGKSLNVVQRESFFDDSFFKEAWGDFDRAVQRVLDKFDNRGLKVDDGSRHECRDAYTQIRSNKIDEDLYASQALQITEKDGKFQVVMDVKDFNPRELQVRAIDERIVVDGAYQKVSEDGSSKSLKTFHKEFTLPDAADIDHVTTALSKDGVLTIKAPKKEGAAITEGPKKSNSNSSSSMQQTSFSQGDNNSTSSFKSSSSKSFVQSSSSFDSSSNDGLEGLSKDMRDRLMFSDSGFGSTKTSTCSSPAPSETGSESSRVSSTMEFDLGKKAPVRTEVSFNVTSPSQPTPQPMFKQPTINQQPQQPMGQQQPVYQHSQQPTYQQPQPQMYQGQQQPMYHSSQQPRPQFQQVPQSVPQHPSQPQSPPYQQFPQQGQPMYQQQPQPVYQQQPQQMYQQQPQQMYQPMSQTAPQVPRSVGVVSGNQSNVSITEENGRKVLTSQTSNVVQEKDGLMEHRETAAEITDKNSQAARREATTKMSRAEEDPEGKFKRSEAADAAEVSESCVQQMPDGSVMSVKKSSSSTSSVKQSFSSSAGDMGNFFQTPNFPTGFGDLRNLMDRGHSLMSQMSTDSMASTLSGRSGFTDMSNFTHFSDASSKFSDMSNFSNMSNFSDMSSMSHQHMANMANMFPETNSSRLMKSFSTSSSTSENKSFSSHFGDGNF